MPSFSQRHILFVSYIIIVVGLLLVFPLRLLPSLLAGLLVTSLCGRAKQPPKEQTPDTNNL